MARDDLITTAEACEILGDAEPLDRSTVSRWVQLGKLKYAKRFPGRNGAFLFHRSDVEALRDRMERERQEASA